LDYPSDFLRRINFTRAAERLHITQSALSQRIKNLEDELGTTLFIRSKKDIRLTEFGERLVRFCQAKEAAENELLSEMKASADEVLAGVLRVGSFSSVARSIILPALSGLLIKNPNLQLRFVVRELYELSPLLRSGEIDFLITTEILKHSDFVSHRLGFEKNVLIQKKGYKGPDVFLDHDEEDRTTVDYFGGRDASKLQRRYLDDIYGIIDGVRLGLGKAVVPHHLIKDLRDIEILNPSKTLSIPIILHYYEQPMYTRLHETAVEALTAISID